MKNNKITNMKRKTKETRNHFAKWNFLLNKIPLCVCVFLLFSICFLKPFVFCYIYLLCVFVYLHILVLLFALQGPPRARQSKRSQTQVSWTWQKCIYCRTVQTNSHEYIIILITLCKRRLTEQNTDNTNTTFLYIKE